MKLKLKVFGVNELPEDCEAHSLYFVAVDEETVEIVVTDADGNPRSPDGGESLAAEELMEKSVIFVDEDGKINQDTLNFFYDLVTKRLFLKGHLTPDYGATAALEIKTGATHAGALIIDTEPGAENAYVMLRNNGNKVGGFRTGDGSRQLTIYGYNGTFFELEGYGAAIKIIGQSDNSKLVEITNPAATKRPLVIVLASGQTANAFEIKDSSGNLLTNFDKNGALQPPSLADSSAPINSIYYSTTANKLVFKDPSGTVNALY